MKNDVLLVNPPAEVVREYYDQPDFPHIGIAYIAAYLKNHGMDDVSVIDGKLAKLTIEQTVEEVKKRRPRILGLTAMTHQIVATHKLALAVKDALPETITVLGGFHGSFLPERTLKEFPKFDYISVGEGEVAFHEFVHRVGAGDDVSGVQGIAGRRGDSVYVNGRGAIPEDLDDLGMPAWEMFPNAPKYHVMSQRGCPFGCNFCSRPYGRKLRHRSVSHVIKELRIDVETCGSRNIHFADETFTVRKDYVSELCEAIVAEGFHKKAQFWCHVHANTIDLRTAKLMKAANFTEVGFGVESGNPRILRQMKKGIGREDVVRAANVLREAKIRFATYFIIGHPGETEESVKDSVSLAIELNPTSVAFGLMVPYPGTEIWEMVTRGEGGYKVISANWEDFNKQIGNALELDTLPRKRMEQLQIKAYLTVYLRTYRYREMAQAIWKNRGRIAFILKKLVHKTKRVAASSWLAGPTHEPTKVMLAEKRAKTIPLTVAAADTSHGDGCGASLN
jgi:anaerobic magnesium-protoporphyrin IX monomethyl ester cyclase